MEKRKVPFSNAPKDDRNLADIHVGLYDDVVVFDHVEKVNLDKNLVLMFLFVHDPVLYAFIISECMLFCRHRVPKRRFLYSFDTTSIMKRGFITLDIFRIFEFFYFLYCQKVYAIHWVRLDRYSSIEAAYKDGMKRLESLLARIQTADP